MFYSYRFAHRATWVILVLFFAWLSAVAGWIFHAMVGWNFWVVFTASSFVWPALWWYMRWRELRLYRQPVRRVLS